MINYARERLRNISKFSEKITYWIGSVSSIFLHTLVFIGIFSLQYFGVPFVNMMVILNTAVSLEAIYLAIFIQMTVNRHTADIEDIQEDVQELGEGVEELGEEVGDIGEDIEGITEDIQEKEEEEGDEERSQEVTFEKLEGSMQKILADIETLKNEIRK